MQIPATAMMARRPAMTPATQAYLEGWAPTVVVRVRVVEVEVGDAGTSTAALWRTVVAFVTVDSFEGARVGLVVLVRVRVGTEFEVAV